MFIAVLENRHCRQNSHVFKSVFRNFSLSFCLCNYFLCLFPEAVKCRRLTIKQCQNSGYNFTSVSEAYQQMVESSAIFQDSEANSTLRKIICMEIAPPCDAKNNQTLIVPCRSMCNEAFNESQSQFINAFKAQKYCSTFPEVPDNITVYGKGYCTLQAWPENGYWPSGLWATLATTGMSLIIMARLNQRPGEEEKKNMTLKRFLEQIFSGHKKFSSSNCFFFQVLFVFILVLSLFSH